MRYKFTVRSVGSRYRIYNGVATLDISKKAYDRWGGDKNSLIRLLENNLKSKILTATVEEYVPSWQSI